MRSHRSRVAFASRFAPGLRGTAATATLLAGMLLVARWQQHTGAQTSDAYAEPEVRYSRNGLLDITLDMRLARHTLAGRTIETATYGGTLPGPTLRVKPGDLLKIKLVNNLTLPGGLLPTQRVVGVNDVYARSIAMMRRMGHSADAGEHGSAPDPQAQLFSNIHTHGLQVTAEGHGDNPFLIFKPGETFNYEIQIPADQPAGLFWYHPHKHGSTAKQAWAGMAGMIIVEGALDRLPFVVASQERSMVLNEIWVDHEGHVPAGIPIPVAGHQGHAPFSSIPAVPTNTYYTINGVYQPVITIQPGQTQRWRIVNAAPHRFFKLTLDGHTLYQIAQDGLTLAAPRAAREILVAPGNRIEVMIQGGNPGIYKFKALEYDQGHPGGPMPEDVLATVVSKGIHLRQAIPTRLLTPDDLRNEPIARRRTVRFKGSTLHAPVEFFLDDKPFDPERDDQTVICGQTEEWTLVNEDVFQHPFHIHVNPFQVVEVNGQRVEDPIWWDTFALPPHGEVKILMRPRLDIQCRTVYHCHILPHEDNGMMSAISLVR